jgi:GntR family transcriptional regulator
VLPFLISIQPGESPVKQVVFAASRAILAGVMRPGAPFPSVRDLSEALKLHPNTMQKAVAELVRDGFLVVRPGVGTFVASTPRPPSPDRFDLLDGSVDQLVVEARRLGLDRVNLVDVVERRWSAVFGSDARKTGTDDVRARGTRTMKPRRS